MDSRLRGNDRLSFFFVCPRFPRFPVSRPLHLKQSAELLAAILGSARPADKQMERYFRAHREMGVRDRAEVAETVYRCLRERRLLAHCAGEAAGDLVAACLVREGASGRALEEAGYRGDARALVACLRTLDAAALPFAVAASLPDWLAQKLLAQYGDDARALADALNRPAPVDLRVNTVKARREEAQARLAAEGFAADPTPYSPVGLRLRERAPVFRSTAFKEGWIEVQDEGSQLVSLLLEPRRGEMVVDFCAGAGGKTLHLGALMANTGSLYAFDVSAARLEGLAPRLARSGLSNVRPVVIAHERDDRVRRLQGKTDRVLVDAPCTGTGTLRRNPDLKWRDVDSVRLGAEQARILDAAALLPKPGGRLVYATCSLLREENEDVVRAFLERHPAFRAVPAKEILARRHVTLPAAAGDVSGTTKDTPRSLSPGCETDRMKDASACALRLLPHRHGTDGFYAVALERVG